MIQQFTWIVIHGLKLWRKIWFRTANIQLGKWVLEEWTYKINGFFSKKIYPWVGTYLEKKWVFEAHFLNFNGNIYGKEVEIIVLEKIRDNKKFNSLDEIKSQIQKDIQDAKKIKNIVLSFWTFDILHKWHLYYLKQAKKLWDKLVTIVARDTNVLKFKGKLPHFNEKERKKHIEKAKVSDIVKLWDLHNPLKWIDTFSPSLICLWYDQRWFSDKLTPYLKEKWIGTQILKIPPFKEDTYKSSIIKNKKLQLSNKEYNR